MDAVEVKEAPAVKKRKPLDPKKKKWIRRAIIVLAVIAAVWLLFLRPMGKKAHRNLDSLYLTETAQTQELTVSVSGSGVIAPIDSYRVSAMAMGEVLEAPFEEGDWVEKGDLLYRIDAGDAETAVRQAELSLRQAQLRYDDLARSQRPTAGSAGVVQQVLVRRGDLVSPGTPLAVISDSKTMTLSLPFQSADAAAIFPGQSALVTIEGSFETLPATVESVSAADLAGPGGTLIRQVKLRVENPGALTSANTATAMVGTVSCAQAGNFEEDLRRTVISASSGEVTNLYITPGTPVSASTVLMELGGDSAASSLENASLSVESAQLGLQRAKDALDNYTVTAPISGTVIEKNFKVGDKLETDSLTAAGGALAVLYDMSTLTFKMNINDLDINDLAVGQAVSVTSEALKGQTFTGHVERISINGITAGGFTSYPVTVHLDEDGSGLVEQGLKPGMNINAEILVAEAGQVLCLPIDAVGRGDVVLVAGEGALDENGKLADPSKLEERTVKLGRNGQDMVEIVEGLSEGETVYIHNKTNNMMSMMMGG